MYGTGGGAGIEVGRTGLVLASVPIPKLALFVYVCNCNSSLAPDPFYASFSFLFVRDTNVAQSIKNCSLPSHLSEKKGRFCSATNTNLD